MNPQYAAAAATTVSTVDATANMASKAYASAINNPQILLAVILLLVAYIIYTWYQNGMPLLSGSKKKKVAVKEKADEENLDEKTDKLISSIEEKQNGA